MTPTTTTLRDAPGDHTGRERMQRALQSQSVDRPPIWFMRQAGRYLPEYQEIRQRHSFETRMHDPDLATEITLQPLRRFPLDAAIFFSDILEPLAPLGHPARIVTGGPVIEDPVRTPEQVDHLATLDPASDLPHVADILGRIRSAAPEHAVLGFAGAPFTLAAYLIDGRGSKGFPEAFRFAHTHPEAWRQLLNHLADAAADLLIHQARQGIDAVQLFDTWAELLAPADYVRWAAPATNRVIDRVQAATDIPIILFARGTTHLLPHLAESPADVLSIDWRMALATVRAQYPEIPLQGNLDPTTLFAPPAVVAERTRQVLTALDGHAHVFNLGHGILPGTPLEGVQAMVDTVTGWQP